MKQMFKNSKFIQFINRLINYREKGYEKQVEMLYQIILKRAPATEERLNSLKAVKEAKGDIGCIVSTLLDRRIYIS